MRHALPLAALWTMALLAYSNSFTAALTFDSNRVVLQDTRIRAVTPENRHLIWTQDYWYPTLAGDKMKRAFWLAAASAGIPLLLAAQQSDVIIKLEGGQPKSSFHF